MAMKNYSTLSRASELEPYHRMRFCVMYMTQFDLRWLCCGVDKCAGSANNFKRIYMRVRMCVVTARDNEGRQKDGITDTTNVKILFAGITNVYVNVRGGCMWSSARWVTSLAGMVDL